MILRSTHHAVAGTEASTDSHVEEATRSGMRVRRFHAVAPDGSVTERAGLTGPRLADTSVAVVGLRVALEVFRSREVRKLFECRRAGVCRGVALEKRQGPAFRPLDILCGYRPE